jgi:hypothetical protein
VLQCKPGFTSATTDGECRACPSKNDSWAISIVITTVFVIL